MYPAAANHVEGSLRALSRRRVKHVAGARQRQTVSHDIGAGRQVSPWRNTAVFTALVALVSAFMAAGLSYLGTRQQIHAQADQQRQQIQSQAEQQRDSYLRAERKVAYALMLQTDIAAQADEIEFKATHDRRHRPWTDAELKALVDNNAESRRKFQDALVQVSIVGSTDSVQAATRLVTAHQLVATIVDEFAGSGEDPPGTHYGLFRGAMSEVEAASQAFTGIVRVNLGAQ